MEAVSTPHAAPVRPSSRSRLLLPREHGTYGQIALPLIAALLARPVTFGATALTVAAFAFYLAHEPLLVIAGLRGSRARREDGARAHAWLAVCTLIGALAGTIGALRVPDAARVALVIPAGLSLAVGGFILARRERTLLGEVTAACALASASVPVMIADGVSVTSALWALVAWSVGFGAVTPAVRGVIAHQKSPVTLVKRLAPLSVPWALWCVMVAASAPPATVLAALPLLVVASVLSVWPPYPQHLRRIGWALVAATVVATAALARM
jgi:hypothetical protein